MVKCCLKEDTHANARLFVMHLELKTCEFKNDEVRTGICDAHSNKNVFIIYHF